MSKTSWNRIRKKLEQLDKAALLKVIKELYQLSANNKTMLARDFDTKATEDPLAPQTMREIASYFDSERGSYSVQIAPARKALREYCKVATPHDGINMRLYYVRTGIQISHDYGGINARFYDSLEGVYQEAIQHILDQAEPASYRHQLEQLILSSEGIAWGFYDAMVDVFSQYVESLKKI